ncbi:MAG: 50S ribosomal protein L18a [Candidatus Heimdallarchaeota archaeon]|nr:50S ribosomal protein L18a [Candidatus Heimdallarchaeota archaeon]
MPSNVKIFRAKGYFRKNKSNFQFTSEFRALEVKHGLEKLYSELGSRHRLKRTEIFIDKKDGIKEITADEAIFSISTQMDEPDFEIQIDN